MGYENNYEQEIDLKELLFAILYRWRPIILAGILMGILLGGYKAAKTWQEQSDPEMIEKTKTLYEEELMLYENNLTGYEREITSIINKIEDMNTYMGNSVLMQISPYDVPVATANLYIKTDYEIMPGMTYQNPDYTNSLLRAYGNAINQGGVLQGISELVSIEPQYLSELVKAEVDYGNKMVNVSVSALDPDTAETILNKVLDNVEGIYTDMKTSIGDHKISVSNQGTAYVVDTGLVKTQEANRNNEAALQKALSEKRIQMKELKEPSEPVVSQMIAVKKGIKFTVFGGVLGAFLIVFVVCVQFLMSDRLISDRELKNRYDMKILGRFDRKRTPKFLGGIDSWLDKVSGNRVGIEDATVCQVAAANITNYMPDGKKIVLTGTVPVEELEKLKEELKKLISDKEIFVDENLNVNAKTLQNLPMYDGVVLVEKRNVSLYTDIEKEVETIKNLNKTLIGCLVL